MERTEPCPQCKGTNFREWRSEGDLTCMKCGLVVEEHMIDEASEWRTFSEQDKMSTNPNRVGAASNPLLTGLTTVIAHEKGDKGLSSALKRVHARSNNPDKALQKVFQEIGDLCDQLYCSKVKHAACAMYKDVKDNKRMRGRSSQSIYVACVFIACRDSGIVRTFKEILALCPSSKKDVHKCYSLLVRECSDAAGAGGALPAATGHPIDLVVTYGNAINLAFEHRKSCTLMADRAKPSINSALMPWDGRTPITIASTIVFIMLCLLEIRRNAGEGSSSTGSEATALGRSTVDKLLDNVKTASHAAPTTIRATYREMHPHLGMLTKDIATEDELRYMPAING